MMSSLQDIQTLLVIMHCNTVYFVCLNSSYRKLQITIARKERELRNCLIFLSSKIGRYSYHDVQNTLSVCP